MKGSDFTGEGVVQSPDSRGVLWFKQARAGLELLRQQATLRSAGDLQLAAGHSGGVQALAGAAGLHSVKCMRGMHVE